jgi:hypothetical protein
VILPQRTVICLSAYLPRSIGQQRAFALNIRAYAVSEILRKLLLQEQGIYVETVERMPYLPHLIIMDDGDVRMIDWCANVVRIVVCLV